MLRKVEGIVQRLITDILIEQCNIKSGDKLLLAVSGGIDSMALLDLLTKISKCLNFEIVICHLDHMYRGDDAIRDMKIVKAYAQANNLVCYTYRRPVQKMAKVAQVGFEEMARKVRYRLFDALMLATGCRYLVTAHHMDDQAETVLAHLIRGSGLNGLRGMSVVSGKQIRPLLEVSKQVLEDYVKQNGIVYGQDDSNHDITFTRNSIRHELIPFIEKRYNPNFRYHMAKLADIVNEQNVMIDAFTDKMIKQLVKDVDDYRVINTKAFTLCDKGLQRILLRRLYLELRGHLHDISTRHIDILIAWIEHGKIGGRQNIKGITFEKRRHAIYVSKTDAMPIKSLQEIKLDYGTIHLKDWRLSIEVSRKERPLKASESLLCVEQKHLHNGLYLRSRQAGDYIYLKGMKGHKKSLKKLYNDLKIPVDKRQRVPVIASRREVLWVYGYKKAYLEKTSITNKLAFIYVSPL